MRQILRAGLGELTKRNVELERIYRMRTEQVTPVRQPLFLVSQVNRSGGTLLAQLFDGHPECHVHPGELHIGYPKKDIWPDLDLSEKPEQWFTLLFERRLLEYSKEGFVKVPQHLRSSYDAREIRYPFIFLPKLQLEIFRACAAQGVSSQRDVLDCYMTSYFNAWLDYQGLYGSERKCVAAFVPRMSMREDSVERFFRDYPTGKLVSIVRDPKTWFVSFAKKKPDERVDVADAIPRWKRSAEAALANKKRYGDRVVLLRFESLLRDVEPTMRSLARDLGLAFDECLLTPTFQGMPIRANSTFRVEQHGVLDAPLRRAQDLSPAEIDGIDRESAAVYAAFLAEIGSPADA
jgi:hypothetical protein